MNRKFYLICCLVFLFLDSKAQETVINGRITDAVTNEAIPYATVRFVGTTNGTNTDFDGYYTIRSYKPIDSLKAAYLGYFEKTKKVKRGQTQKIDFQLQPNSKGLQEAVILGGEDPSMPMIRKAIKNKNRYTMTSLRAYQFESYSKIQIDVNNVSNFVRKRKVLKPVLSLLDSLKNLAGEDGAANFPMFFSETVSDLYFTREPINRKKEFIKASKVSGVGIKNGELTSQFSGTSFQDYNFNNDKLFLFGKEFMSPIADVATGFYRYYLLDSSIIDGYKCYKIRVKPRNDQDLAFTGNIWLVDSLFCLKQVNLEIPKSANLNFIEKVQIQMEMNAVGDSVWFPVKTRSVINVADISSKFASLIFKTYLSAKNIVINQPKNYEFYENKIELAEDAFLKEDDYWKENRHENLSATEINVFKMIDTVKKIPVVRTTTDVLYAILNQYYTVGKVDLGPFYTVYGHNIIQGHRFRLGFRTNPYFSKRWILRGYIASGTKEKNVLHYNAQVEYILSRKRWTKLGIQRREDIDQLGYQYNYDDNPAFYNQQSSLYTTASEITGSPLFNRKTENRIWIERQLVGGFTPRLAFHNTSYQSLFDLKSDSSISFDKNYVISEMNFDLRYAPDEYYVQKGNKRVRLGTLNKPVVTLSFTHGFKGVLGSKIDYDKVNLSVRHRIRMGILGYSLYTINSGKILSAVPYPLLEVHRGNQTPFMAIGTFNMMNYSEFISDYFVSLSFQHHFEGLLLNRIPLMRKLKWRELVSLNGVYGGLSKINAAYNENKNFSTLEKRPYLEASGGIENILKLIRVDFLYRLTYTDAAYRTYYDAIQVKNGIADPFHIHNWGIKFSVNFAF